MYRALGRSQLPSIDRTAARPPGAYTVAPNFAAFAALRRPPRYYPAPGALHVAPNFAAFAALRRPPVIIQPPELTRRPKFCG
eukprot:6184385-Pleurochrysis_carterae.AAC.1